MNIGWAGLDYFNNPTNMSSSSQVELSIIIVNYQTPKLTLDCLASIAKSSDKLIKEVIVVDNASQDDSINQIRAAYPRVEVIANSSNSGFASANNLGVNHARGEFVLLLNSDTELMPDSLEKLIHQARLHDAKIASCHLLNPDGSTQPQGGALPSLPKVMLWMLGFDDLPLIKKFVIAYQHNHPDYFKINHQAGWIGGTAMLVQRDIYRQLGGLDENIFMYGEDVEFCFRAHQAKIIIWYFSQPKIIHLGQGSGSSARARIGEFSGIRYLYRKHKSQWQGIILNSLLKTGAFLRMSLFAMMGEHEKQKIYQQALVMD